MSPTTRWHCLILFLTLLLAGCLHPPPAIQTEGLGPLPCRYQLTFRSELAESYVVLAGPIESYAHLPVNRWTRGTIEQLLAARSDPSSSRTLDLTVHLLSLKTDYDQLGAALPRGGVRLAANDLLARRWPGQFEFDEGPAEVHKSARLVAQVRLAEGERTLFNEVLTVETKTIVERWYFDAWTYDYGVVIRDLIRRLATEIDTLLVAHAPSGR